MRTSRKEILEKAAECVCTDRNLKYGEPENNFPVIADLWSAFLCAKTGKTVILGTADVADMMILFKLGREITGKGSVDSYIDIAGYAACAGSLIEVDNG